MIKDTRLELPDQPKPSHRNKLLLLIAAVVSGFLICELLLHLSGLPGYGVKEYVTGLDRRSWDKSRIYGPHSRYLVTEGKFKGRVFQRNNRGFPGTDLDNHQQYGLVLVLGSSFLEAQQVPPQEISTALCNDSLSSASLPYRAVNLGFRGTNPYYQYFRAVYWDKRLQADKVILLIDHFPFQDMDVTPDWQLPPAFGQKDKSPLHNIYRTLRNYSILANLIVPSLNVKTPQPGHDAKSELHNQTRQAALVEQKLNRDLKLLADVVIQYRNRFGPRLIIINTAPEQRTRDGRSFYAVLENLCRTSKVEYHQYPLLNKPGYRYEGGHLNQSGNAALGRCLFQILKSELANNKE